MAASPEQIRGAATAETVWGEAPPPDASLLSPEMTARLKRLALIARRLPGAQSRGRRRTRRIGGGVEPIDTRAYSPGDDPRRIAWPAYARLERLLVWLVADEAPLRLVLIVDTSGSMGFGRPSKLVQATRIAAGLAVVALGSEDRVATVATSSKPEATLRAASGRVALARLLETLDGLEPGGETDLAAAAATATACAGGRGLCVLLSDLFDPAGALAGARALRAQGHEVALVEVLDPFEVDPPDLSGLVVEDEETGELVELPPTRAREAYLDGLAAHRAAVDAEAAQLGAPVLRVTTDEPFDAVVGRAIQVGLVRAGSTS